jgi:hypothetical protein
VGFEGAFAFGFGVAFAFGLEVEGASEEVWRSRRRARRCASTGPDALPTAWVLRMEAGAGVDAGFLAAGLALDGLACVGVVVGWAGADLGGGTGTVGSAGWWQCAAVMSRRKARAAACVGAPLWVSSISFVPQYA